MTLLLRRRIAIAFFLLRGVFLVPTQLCLFFSFHDIIFFILEIPFYPCCAKDRRVQYTACPPRGVTSSSNDQISCTTVLSNAGELPVLFYFSIDQESSNEAVACLHFSAITG